MLILHYDAVILRLFYRFSIELNEIEKHEIGMDSDRARITTTSSQSSALKIVQTKKRASKLGVFSYFFIYS